MIIPCNQPCPYNTLRGCIIHEYPGKCCPLGNMEKQEYKPLTNADSIRAMSDEELSKIMSVGCCGGKNGYCIENEYGEANCIDCWIKWLKQPAEEER